MNPKDYTSRPIDTSDIRLLVELNPLLETMAQNVHEKWAQERSSQGWTYGKQRDDTKKHHPCLIDYKDYPSRRISTTAIPLWRH